MTRFAILGAETLNHGRLYYETTRDESETLIRLADDIANVQGLAVRIEQDGVKVYTAHPNHIAMRAVYGMKD